MLRERLKELIHELDCIKYGRFKLASGKVSSYKIVCDPLFKNDEAREILGTLGSQLFQKIEDNDNYDIVGVITGGYEFAELIGKKTGREIIGVNPHNNTVVGKLKHSNRFYSEDVTTTGESIIKCHNTLGSTQGSCYAIVIVDREEGSEDNLRNKGIKLKCLLTKKDLGI